MEEILNKVCKASGFTVEEIRSGCRKDDLVAARMLFEKKAKEEKGYPDKLIAARINRKRVSVTSMRSKYNPTSYYIEYEKAYREL